MIKEHILLWELIKELLKFGMLIKVLKFIKLQDIKKELVPWLGEVIKWLRAPGIGPYELGMLDNAKLMLLLSIKDIRRRFVG